MSHPSIPPRKRQRSSRPHQITLETDDDDNDDAAPSESNTIDDNGKAMALKCEQSRWMRCLQTIIFTCSVTLDN